MGNPKQPLTKRPFLAVWTMAVVAATAAFALHLGIRVEGIQLGYELGRVHSELARLREVKRVLELEVASHKTPERIDFVSRTLLGMDAPSKDRIFSAGPMPNLDEAEGTEELNLASGATQAAAAKEAP